MTISPATTDALGAAGDERSQATGIVQTVRQIGGVIGIAVLGAIVANVSSVAPSATAEAHVAAATNGVAAAYWTGAGNDGADGPGRLPFRAPQVRSLMQSQRLDCARDRGSPVRDLRSSDVAARRARGELQRIAGTRGEDGSRGVVLMGPAGVGKSRLAREAHAEAASATARSSSWVQATRSAATVPLGAFAGLLPERRALRRRRSS